MIYKRINNLLTEKKDFFSVNNLGIYLNTSMVGANTAPNHGLYINQEVNKTEVYLSKMLDTFEIDGKKYNIIDTNTSEESFGGVEYLESFVDDPIPTFVYNINGCKIEKKYKLDPNSKMLCIDYAISNKSSKTLKFISKPCVTKRELYETKRKSDLKFTTESFKNSVKIALSITQGLNLYILSPNMKFEDNKEYFMGVNTSYIDESKTLKTNVEDLFIPGSFHASVKSGTCVTFSVFVSGENIDITKSSSLDIETNIKKLWEIRYKNIDKNYVELLNLAKTAYKLQYVDNKNKRLVILDSLPCTYSNDEYIKNVIASIEGNYLCLKRFKEAYKILESMMLKLKDESFKLSTKDRCEANLLFIEALNRYLALSEVDISEVKVFYDYIKTNIYEYLDGKQDKVYADKDFLLMVENKKYIKINSLWYNALRIFQDLADKFNEESEFIYSISESLKTNIEEKFWDEDNKVLKYEIEADAFSTIDMIYALSLSYPVLKNETISMKLMDTAFKELYTALGMRKAKVGSKLYDGFLYPHLMVHFLKANLRQMGVTYASQKLAYNLIKDLLLQIGCTTLETLPYKYDEKTKKSYGTSINCITNAEMIRAYDMLT